MALQFLTDDDFWGSISRNVLTQLRGEIDENIETAEQLAISELSCLRGKYDVDAELAKTTTGRNQELIRILVSITAYYLYNTVVDDEIPERIQANFEKEVKHIISVCKGTYTTLDRLTDSDGENKTNFRYGSDDLRSHDPYY